MSLAVMQPYIFPYIGYFQLIHAVDTFIFYDDVDFIKKGWINRNRILINGKDNLFTVPLIEASQNKKINEIKIFKKEEWFNKFLKTINRNYIKAPYFEPVYQMILDVFQEDSDYISELAIKSVISIAHYTELDVTFKKSSETYSDNSHLLKENRLFDICLRENNYHYINPIGGLNIYSKFYFKENGFKLNFLKTRQFEYKQFNNEFIPWLSIIDVLMFNSKSEVKRYLTHYDLV